MGAEAEMTCRSVFMLTVTGMMSQDDLLEAAMSWDIP